MLLSHLLSTLCTTFFVNYKTEQFKIKSTMYLLLLGGAREMKQKWNKFLEAMSKYQIMSSIESLSDAELDDDSRALYGRRRFRWTLRGARAGRARLGVDLSSDGYWCLVYRSRFLVNLFVKQSAMVASLVYCRRTKAWSPPMERGRPKAPATTPTASSFPFDSADTWRIHTWTSTRLSPASGKGREPAIPWRILWSPRLDTLSSTHRWGRGSTQFRLLACLEASYRRRVAL